MPSKMITLLWLVKHGRLLCNAEKKRRHLTLTDSCPTCVNESETIDHLFHKCPKSKEIWRELVGASEEDRLANMSFKDWLSTNLEKKVNSRHGKNWLVVFAIAMWGIWRWRNELIFRGSEKNLHERIDWILDLKDEISRAKESQRGWDGDGYENITVRWSGPDNGALVLNVDGSVRSSTSQAGGGAVLRSHEGKWRGGFTCRLPWGNIDEIESRMILKGMEWAWTKGIRRLVIQSDSRNAINWIKNSANTFGTIRRVIEECQSWVRRNWDVELSHILREQNYAADAMAKTACRMDVDWKEFKTPPREVLLEILEDRLGTPRPRRADMRYP